MISWYARELLAQAREHEIVGKAERRRMLIPEKPLSLKAPSTELAGAQAATTRRSWFARFIRGRKQTTGPTLRKPNQQNDGCERERALILR
jgi:hypothetical protein